MESTTMTTPLHSQLAPQWQGRLLSQAQMAKTAFRTGDFQTLTVLRAVQEMKLVTTTMPALGASADSIAVKQDLNNLNSATVGTLNNGFSDYAVDTEKLKGDTNPDKPAWEARIKSNGEKLKQKAIAAIDASTDQAIAKINEQPAETRDDFADTFVRGRDVVFDFMKTLGSQIMVVLNNIADFFKGIWNAMVNAWNSVKNAAQDAWNSISGIFSFMAVSPALRIDKGVPLKATWPQEASTAAVSTTVAQTLQSLAQHGVVTSHKLVKLGPGGLSAELSLYDIGYSGSQPDKEGIKRAFERALEHVARSTGALKPSISS